MLDAAYFRKGFTEKRSGKYKQYKQIYELNPEIFYFHHRLRFADKKVLDYIKNKDILDCGAYVGDSLLVLRNYTNRNIYRYEFSSPNLSMFNKVMQANNVKSDYVLRPVALGDENKIIQISNQNNVSMANRIISGKDLSVEMVTIDSEKGKFKFKAGFIKMDVEGFGWNVIKGAIKTIQEDRPVLSLGVYHNPEELFKIKPFLEENLPNYKFEFQLQQFDTKEFHDMTLIGYQKEIFDDEK